MKLFEDKQELRHTILSAEDIPTEIVEVPEWGVSLRVQGLSGVQRDMYENSVFKSTKSGKTRQDLRNARARLVAWSVVDEDGKRVFADADINELGRKSALALSRVFTVALRLSGLREEDIEEFVENFDDGQSEDSSSG